MTTVMPEGEDIRKAAKWIEEERRYDPARKLQSLIEAACLKFNLSPREAEFLSRHFREAPKTS